MKCCYLIIFLVYSKKEFIQNIMLLLVYRSVFQHTVGWLEILVIKKGIAPRFCTSKAYLCISIYIWSYLHLLYSMCYYLFWPCLSTSYKWISNFFILSALWTSICSVWCKMTYLITEVHGSTYYFIFFVLQNDFYCVGFLNGGLQTKDGENMVLLGGMIKLLCNIDLFIPSFLQNFMDSIADLVLSNKLVVYNLENQVIGWTDYNCKWGINL